MEWLTRNLQKREQMMHILAALRSTEDPAVLPLFTALGQNKDQELRRLAPSVLMEIGGQARAATLLKPMADDTQPEIRAEVLLYLSSLDAVDKQMLTDAMQVGDERLQCLAARSLIKMGQGPAAVETLKDLTRSKDKATESMARMALLAMGSSSQVEPLARMIQDSSTPASVLMLLSEQASELKVSAAVELIESIATDPDRPLRLRTHAYKALAELAKDGPDRLTRAIVSSQEPLPIYLLVLLSQTDQAETHLKSLAGRSGLVGTLARFELARKGTAEQLQRQAAAVIGQKHPIVVNYVLERAIKDIEQRPKVAAGYQQPLLGLLQGLQSKRGLRQIEIGLVEDATRVVAEIGSRQGLAELRRMLSQRVSPFTQAVAGGLVRVENPAVCTVAVDLLESPYKQLATMGAFTLGRHGRKEAAGTLAEMVRKPDRFSPTLVALASWYLLKIEDAQAAGIGKLSEMVR
jgi:HEAT repeat protein